LAGRVASHLFASLMTICGVVSADSGRLCLAPTWNIHLSI
jgi:hypothetical protein